MGDHLKADITRIRDSATSLETISQRFNDAGKIVAGYSDAVGNSHLADKLHDFATNWEIHRKKIVEDLTVFSEWANGAADAYEDTDKQLAEVLEEGPKEQ